jgi:hypothetical protein
MKANLCMRWLFVALFGILFGLLPAVSPLGSDTCLEPSPSAKAGGDPYGPLTVRDLTRPELEQTRALLQSLRGDWIGKGGTLRCKSLEDPLDHEQARYTLRGRVNTDHFGNLVVTADLYDIDQKISHQEIFRLYLKDRRLRHEDNGGAGDVELKLLSAHQIQFLWRVVIPAGQTPGSTRKEYDITLTGDSEAFSIVRIIYTQAKFSSRSTWHFKRR